jgi:RNA polymerase sigma-70 factor (ECF subfamily)
MRAAPSEPRLQTALHPEERELLAALQRCDEAAFARFVDAQHGGLVRFAALYVTDAEALAQETWGAFVSNLLEPAPRQRLKHRLYAALLACARAHAPHVPHARHTAGDVSEPSVAPGRFMTEGVWAGGWASPPHSFGDALAGALSPLAAALAQLPPAQREVVLLRDAEGFSADEACELLGVSEPSQRQLLHHGRARLRTAVEQHLARAS